MFGHEKGRPKLGRPFSCHRPEPGHTIRRRQADVPLTPGPGAPTAFRKHTDDSDIA